MPFPRTARWIVLAVVLLLLAVELQALVADTTTWSTGWFPLLLVVLAASVLSVRHEIRAVSVLSFFLALISAAWAHPPALPDWLSGILFLLCPFLFVHFAMIFPVPNDWIERNPRRLFLIYAPFAALLVSCAGWIYSGKISGFMDAVFGVVIAAGFALGLSIFVYQYLFSLTGSEKNRLQVILIGCLAGLVPYFLSTAASSAPGWQRVAFFLLPLFPAALVFAVVRENFCEISNVFRLTLVYSLVSAGVISAFYASYVALPAFWASETADRYTVLVSLLISAIVVYPLQRWAWGYIAARFHRTSGRRTTAARMEHFRPIEPNPYIVGNPVQSPEMFFGRSEDFQFIKTRLQGQREGCIVLLYGDRRAGKTSILHQVVNGRLGDRFIPAFIDMQGLVVQNDGELLQGFGAAILEATGLAAAAASGIGGYRGFTELLDKVMASVGNRQLVILLDEYELIELKVTEGKISPEIYDYVTSLLERYPHQLSFIFTGSRSAAANSWHSLLGKSVARKISFLSPHDAEDLICKPLADRVQVESESVAEFLRLTRGHPFFTQLLCQIVVEVLNEQCAVRVDRDIVQQVVDRALENPPPQLIYQWNSFANPEKLLLASLGALLRSPDSFASWEQVDRTIQSLPRECRQNLDAPRTRMSLEGLRAKDVLDRDQNRYRFAMDLMRRWIRTEHDVWSVLNETGINARMSPQKTMQLHQG